MGQYEEDIRNEAGLLLHLEHARADVVMRGPSRGLFRQAHGQIVSRQHAPSERRPTDEPSGEWLPLAESLDQE
jgi:hypothetical protein